MNPRTASPPTPALLLLAGPGADTVDAIATALSSLGFRGAPDAEAHPVRVIHEQFWHEFGVSDDWLGRLPDGWQRSNAATRAHDRLSEYVGSLTPQSMPWLIDTPHLGRLLPLWHSVLQVTARSAALVIVLEEPQALATRWLHTRRVNPRKSLLTWGGYYQDAIPWASRFPSCVITTRQWQQERMQVLTEIGLICAQPPDVPRTLALPPDAAHTAADAAPSLPPTLLPLAGQCTALYWTLQLSQPRGWSWLTQATGGLRDNYAEWSRRFHRLTVEPTSHLHPWLEQTTAALPISLLLPLDLADETEASCIADLERTLRSVREQQHQDWEVCITVGPTASPAVLACCAQHVEAEPRIRLQHVDCASAVELGNAALAMAKGTFVALPDLGDRLDPWALFWVAASSERCPAAVLLYSDEDRDDEDSLPTRPWFKCRINPDLLLAQDMVGQLAVFRRESLCALGGLAAEAVGAVRYDLVLRLLEHAPAEATLHIPKVLYHRQARQGAVTDSAAARRAVERHLQRVGARAEVLPAPEAPAYRRVRFMLPAPHPRVSVLIPTRDRAQLLSACVTSVLEHTRYPAYDIVILDNGSEEQATHDLFARLPAERVRIVRDDRPFNFSALINLGVTHAQGEYVCWLNNDTEVLTPDWLDELVSQAARPGVGCVGARLWYPDGRLQHGGVVLGYGGGADHAHKFLRRGHPGRYARAVLQQNFSAVTGACLLVSKALFDLVGGLDTRLAVAFNDVDFCLRVRQAGYRNVWTPYAELLHRESVSRGVEDTLEKQERFIQEVETLRQRWADLIADDPAYSPNLTLNLTDFSLAWPPRPWHPTPSRKPVDNRPLHEHLDRHAAAAEH
jgi:O-antigen biosynthesis protein